MVDRRAGASAEAAVERPTGETGEAGTVAYAGGASGRSVDEKTAASTRRREAGSLDACWAEGRRAAGSLDAVDLERCIVAREETRSDRRRAVLIGLGRYAVLSHRLTRQRPHMHRDLALVARDADGRSKVARCSVRATQDRPKPARAFRSSVWQPLTSLQTARRVARSNLRFATWSRYLRVAAPTDLRTALALSACAACASGFGRDCGTQSGRQRVVDD